MSQFMAPATTTLINCGTSEVVDLASDKGKGLVIFLISGANWSILGYASEVPPFCAMKVFDEGTDIDGLGLRDGVHGL